MKRFQIIIGCLLIVCLFFLFIGGRTTIFDSFSEYENAEVLCNLNKNKSGSGFFSRFFQILNYYIFCEKNRVNFTIQSDDWLYKYKHGWSDYFEDVSLNYYKPEKVIDLGLHQIIDDNLKIIDYKNTINKVYKYNDYTKNEIQKTKSKFGLEDGKYDAIYIRRGDKLVSESVFIPEEKYLNLLMVKNPNCKTIFLQTDDYNCFIELEKQINAQKLPIKLITTCDKESVGVIVHKGDIQGLNDAAQNHDKNKQYLEKIIDKLNKTKPVHEMNSEEVRNHLMDMIVGVDIASKSNVCITDYQSNVARFIKLYHTNSSNVYDVNNPDTDIDYEKVICPTFGF